MYRKDDQTNKIFWAHPAPRAVSKISQAIEQQVSKLGHSQYALLLQDDQEGDVARTAFEQIAVAAILDTVKFDSVFDTLVFDKTSSVTDEVDEVHIDVSLSSGKGLCPLVTSDRSNKYVHKPFSPIPFLVPPFASLIVTVPSVMYGGSDQEINHSSNDAPLGSRLLTETRSMQINRDLDRVLQKTLPGKDTYHRSIGESDTAQFMRGVKMALQDRTLPLALAKTLVSVMKDSPSAEQALLPDTKKRYSQNKFVTAGLMINVEYYEPPRHGNRWTLKSAQARSTFAWQDETEDTFTLTVRLPPSLSSVKPGEGAHRSLNYRGLKSLAKDIRAASLQARQTELDRGPSGVLSWHMSCEQGLPVIADSRIARRIYSGGWSDPETQPMDAPRPQRARITFEPNSTSEIFVYVGEADSR